MVCDFPHILAGFCAEFRRETPGAGAGRFQKPMNINGLWGRLPCADLGTAIAYIPASRPAHAR